MKIALVIERMDTWRGGREKSTAQIAQALAARGQNVTILCQSGSWQPPPDTPPNAINVLPLGRGGLSRSTRLRRFAAAVQRAAADYRYDVVHSMLPIPGVHVYQLRSGTVPAQREAALRRRGLLSRELARLFEPLNVHRMAMAQLERQVVDSPRTVLLAVSRMVAGEIEHYYGRTAGVRVIYNAVDVPDVSPDHHHGGCDPLEGMPLPPKRPERPEARGAVGKMPGDAPRSL